MPSAIALRRAMAQNRGLPSRLSSPSICFFCSFSPSLRRDASTTSPPSLRTTLLRSRRKPLSSLLSTANQRLQSNTITTATASPSTPSPNPRTALHAALLDLAHHAPNHLSLPRLQLAMRNLSEPPGHESVRVAVLAVHPSAAATAKRLTRLALADPLRADAADWEAALEAHDTGAGPLVVRVVDSSELEGVGRGKGEEEGGVRVRTAAEHVVPELRVASPVLSGVGLEVVVAEAGGLVVDGSRGVDDAVLVPTVDVAATTAGHVAPVETPVHMALLVGDGVLGAASIMSLPVLEGTEVISGAVNFAKIGKEDLADCPLVAVNVEAASEGLELFRVDVSNAMKYEALWTEANVGRITEWLRKGVLQSGEGATKAAVRNLITSLLRSARAAAQEEEARDLSAELKTKIPSSTVAQLDQALSEWAQKAHAELQQQLDLAFTTRPWSKLGWWKLFWRADDVGMVTSEMIAMRFIPKAEQDVIYLAGRIQEAGVLEGLGGQPLYPEPASLLATGSQEPDTFAPDSISKWPAHIPFTRNYLQEKTVPALQALAQKLVVQSASLAGLSTALAGLSYLSALGAYECGAIAALGIALSFRRLQQRWDAAREYWEGEVREEGRKAIRATEASVGEVLDKAAKSLDPQADQAAQLEELRKVEEIVTRAEEALARMK